MHLLPFLQELTQAVRETVADSVKNKHWKDIVKRKTTDLTWRVDCMAERRAIDFISSKKISARLVSEEAGTIDIGEEPEIVVILDPLDGSLNFTRSIPFCSVAAAAGPYNPDFNLKDIEAGVVTSIFNGETFYAEKGRGAFKNGQQLSIKPFTPKIDKPLLSLYVHGVGKTRYPYERLIASSKVRAIGSIALELCYIANSSLDAVLDLRGTLRVVDVAAGKIIVEEAGGTVKLIGEAMDRLFDVKKGLCMVAAKNEVLANRLSTTIGFEEEQ